jgi:hypothetical protein
MQEGDVETVGDTVGIVEVVASMDRVAVIVVEVVGVTELVAALEGAGATNTLHSRYPSLQIS